MVDRGVVVVVVVEWCMVSVPLAPGLLRQVMGNVQSSRDGGRRGRRRRRKRKRARERESERMRMTVCRRRTKECGKEESVRKGQRSANRLSVPHRAVKSALLPSDLHLAHVTCHAWLPPIQPGRYI